MTKFSIGIDVGGTNTDAVVLDDDETPIISTKIQTSEDITSGIRTAFNRVLTQKNICTDQVGQVMLGTTHCTNAIVERKGLTDVGILRIGAPAATSVPPLTEWPADLIKAIGDNVATLSGGHEYDGRRISELDENEVRKTVREFRDVEAFAVTSVFSPVQHEHEQRIRDIIREELPKDVSVSLSHDIGHVGLIERENATILNAALTTVAERTADSFLAAMRQHDVDATLYFARNDGTLMNLLQATQHPIFMISSGPANSIRGAAHLSGVRNGIAIDVGGTTTDVGVIQNGFPRESNTSATIGGIDTNFDMPDIVSLAIGGGSLVTSDGGTVTLGPESVGRELTELSRAFGGDVLTATDIEVAAGAVSIGHEEVMVPVETITAVREYIRDRITDAVTKLRTEPSPVPAVVVGGGSFLIPDEIEGISEIHRPNYYDAANAVGVATAQVSGQSDGLYDFEEVPREAALERAKQRAIEDAVESGADESTVSVLKITETPLTYLSGNVVRITVHVAGDLRRYRDRVRTMME